MWQVLYSLLAWLQEGCIATLRLIFTIVGIGVGATPFRESPPDAPPKVLFRLFKMVKPAKCKKVLVLDLDETLVHASPIPLDPTHFDVMVPNGNGTASTMFVCERPYLQYFLAHVSQWFTVVVFTAAVKEYANPIIHKLDRGKVIRKKYFRSDCTLENGQYVKNLDRLSGTREALFSNYIIIDNLPVSYRRNPDNAIPISSFSAQQMSTDEELLKLLPLLEALHAVNDVRSILELRCNPKKQFTERIMQ